MSLEERLQEFTNTLETYHESKWELGKLAAEVVAEFGKGAIGSIAQIAVCHSETVKQWIKVWLAFKDERSIEHSYTYHLAIYHRSKALGINPLMLLNLAIAEGWSQRDIAQYKQEETTKAETQSFICCDSDIVIRAYLKDRGGQKVFCPFCREEIGEFETWD